ncbi:ABC transporter substrate-binding protein [Ruminococcaceae bacterium OttesenSCG-928-D13]|nr:ABC transporter substrate-binding protein [Ruminococcaceae bacterium OttesenSCG-928-D13]
MKRKFALLLALVMCIGLLAACGGDSGSSAPASTGGDNPAPSDNPVELTVVTSYGQEDGNRGIYEESYKAWEAATGNTVHDSSSMSNEEWKAQVLSDFEAGSEPDVLFYFAFADGDPLVNGGKVVPIDEIRAEFPDYASNMDDARIPASTADGKKYVVPTTGIWEGLFCNNVVLAEAGVTAPTVDTTWDEFLEMCQKVKDAGYTPIAVSLASVPHYWFEFLIMNKGGFADHLQMPTESEAARTAWIEGLEGFRQLYELGYLPDNTLTNTDDEAVLMMAEDKAAFLIDGSWKVGWFKSNANSDNYSVTYVPGNSVRSADEIIGGASMGYMITRKAWDDPDKRAAAVSFIEHMTSDDVVSRMSANNLGTNALKNSPAITDFPDKISETAYQMATGAAKQSGAVQDLAAVDARNELFTNDIPQIAAGQMTAEEAVDKFIAAYNG